jgi:hypothetical protein
MKHPFINDLSDKTMDELQTAMSSLNNKLTFAYRTGNGSLIHQLQMAIESYRDAYSKKMDEMMGKQKINSKISIEKDSK